MPETRAAWQVTHGDCRKVVPTIHGIDAIISDPPYGMAMDTNGRRFTKGGREWGAPVAGDDEPFDPAPWLDYPRVVLWGANHYGARLPVGTTLVWVKRSDAAFGTFLSDAEIAWMKGGYGVYCYRSKQDYKAARVEEGFGDVAHPCQKPIGLMAWCLRMAGVEPGMLVVDPYMGSGTTGVACAEMGARFHGVETERRHLDVAVKRLTAAHAQGRLAFGGSA